MAGTERVAGLLRRGRYRGHMSSVGWVRKRVDSEQDKISGEGRAGKPITGSFVWEVWHPRTHALLLIISALRNKCALGLCFFVSCLHLILGVKLYLCEVWGGSY